VAAGLFTVGPAAAPLCHAHIPIQHPSICRARCRLSCLPDRKVGWEVAAVRARHTDGRCALLFTINVDGESKSIARARFGLIEARRSSDGLPLYRVGSGGGLRISRLAAALYGTAARHNAFLSAD
jgi:hypothetical protein